MARAIGAWKFDWQGYLCPCCNRVVEHHTSDELNDCLWQARNSRKKVSA